MIDQKFSVSISRRNSLTSLSTTNSNISNTTASSSNVNTSGTMAGNTGPSAVRNLSTNNLVSIDDRFVKKNYKRASSEVNFHKAQGTYYFPNGEVFRPRNSPARRNKPGKINSSGHGNAPSPNESANSSRHGSISGNPDPNSMYHYASTNSNTPVAGKSPLVNTNVHRTGSMDSLSSLHKANLPRSHSSSNVRKLQSKNLAQSLRSNRADTPTNITLFQQHLSQQLQQHQPGQMPQQYSSQFQQFQQLQSQQPLPQAQPLPQKQSQQPAPPQVVQSPTVQIQPHAQNVPQQHASQHLSPHRPPHAGPSMPGGFHQYTVSNNSSASSLKTYQSTNVVKNFGMLNNNSDNSIENNGKSDSNLSSVSNYTLIRSTSNTPQTSISNSLDDEKSNKSRPNSSAQESIDESSILKETEKEHELDEAASAGEKSASPTLPNNSLSLVRTPETDSKEVFSTPLSIYTTTTPEVEKFQTPLTSPINEPKDLFEDKDVLNLGQGQDTQQSIASSIYSSNDESSKNDNMEAEKVANSGESDVTPNLTPIPTPGALDTRFSSPRTITPIKHSFDQFVHDDDDNSSNYPSTRSSSFPSASQSRSQSPSHSHEDVDDLLNDYQTDSPMSKKHYVDYDALEPESDHEEKPNDANINVAEAKSFEGQEKLSEVINDDSVPKRGDITIVNDKVVKDSRISSSSSYNSLVGKKNESGKESEEEEVKESPEVKGTPEPEAEIEVKNDEEQAVNEEKVADKKVEDLMPSPTVSHDDYKDEGEQNVSVKRFGSPREIGSNKESDPIDSSPFIDTVSKETKVPIKAPPVKSMLDFGDAPASPSSKSSEKKRKTSEPAVEEKKVKTPTKPKKKAPSNSPLVERVPRGVPGLNLQQGTTVVESLQEQTNKDKSLPTTPTQSSFKEGKKLKTTKSFGSLQPTGKGNKSIWKKVFNKKPVSENSSPTKAPATTSTTRAVSDNISFRSRSSLSSRTSTDVKSLASNNKSSAASVSSKPSAASKLKKFASNKKSFSFKDLRISSFKIHNDEPAPPLPVLDNLEPQNEPDDADLNIGTTESLIPEDLALTKLPSIEMDDNLFGDVLTTFDEKLDNVGRKATVKHTSLNVNEPFLKDDELTRDQIEDQQLKDTKMISHSRSNSDDYIDENLLFLKDELIWPVDAAVSSDVRSLKSIRSSRSIEEPGNRNSNGVKSTRSVESEDLVGGEEDVFYIDNEQLNNLFNNITENQRRKLPMHLKYIKQFRDYQVLEINIKKFENLTNSKLEIKNNKVVSSILRKSSKYGGAERNSLNSRDRNTKQLDRKPKPTVQFSNKIVVNETFSPDIYSRYNKSVTQYTLTEPIEITRIKNELNEYKCNEMLVHEKSQNNTHFFY